MQPLSLEYAILAALTFSDLFDFPLTAEEIWRNLFSPAKKDISFFDVIEVLEQSIQLRERVEFSGGFYFLKGKKENVTLRLDRYLIAERKYTRAKKIVKILAGLPFVEMISVCNTLGWSNARDESDIDFFIVAKSGHLWMVRLLCTGLMQICGARPKKYQMKDTICLSFFASDEALELSSLFLEEKNGVPDIYFLYWIPHCVPLYDSGGVYGRFWKANEKTVVSALPYASWYDTNNMRRVWISRIRIFFKKFLEGWCELFGNVLEHAAQKFQMRVLPESLKNIVNIDTRVVMNNRILKFHEEDRRKEIRERFIGKLKEMGLKTDN